MIVFLFACQDVDFPTPESENLVGEWEWISSSGGISGKGRSASDESYSKQLIFENKGKYKLCTDDKVDGRGKYELKIFKGERYELNLKNEDAFGKRWLIFGGADTIALYPANCADCFSDTYARK